jgi:hypothetical protein
MAVSCERCGSVRLARTKESLYDTFLGILTGLRLWKCLRCGWSGHRKWKQRDIPQLPGRDESDNADTNPSLRVVDEILSAETARVSIDPDVHSGDDDVSRLEAVDRQLASSADAPKATER